MFPYEDATTLSFLYHLNSEPWLNTNAYEAAAYKVDYKEIAGARGYTALPAPKESPLLELLRSRASCRRYQSQPLPLAMLATLLGGACGIARTGTIEVGVNGLFRSAPSAGGLFPLELYVLTEGVEGLVDGIHHYAVRKHRLELVRAGTKLMDQQGILIADQFVRHANVVVFISAVFARTQKKYGPRGYRYILLEAGHVAQNLCLLATEQKLGSLCMGGFMDSKLNRFLGLDGIHEAVLYSVGIGFPDSASDPLEVQR